MKSHKPRVGVYKFTSCDGCQLALLNAGQALITLAELVEFVHFAEAGFVDESAPVDIALVEGSVSTPQELKRIQQIRAHSQYLITIGACATAGGLQALRNYQHVDQWMQSIYASPQHIQTLATSTSMSEHVKVDLELWGCPINTQQVMRAIRDLLSGVAPRIVADSECLECKRRNLVCVMVAKGQPCMGPVTKMGCGALCPSAGRGCYACYGPSENPNTSALSNRLAGLGLLPQNIADKFRHINNHAAPFEQATHAKKHD
jgi:sulfhydrogenase subunit delta